MRLAASALAVAIAATTMGAAMAFPDGAPWGAADPAAPDHCANCHFDSDALSDSEALTINGLPPRAEPGGRYRLTVVLTDPDAVIAGFQMIATADDGPGGSFSSDLSSVETAGSAIRSVEPVIVDADARWTLEWHVPGDGRGMVVFHVAATAANHDGSPFGDQVHYRSYAVEIPW